MHTGVIFDTKKFSIHDGPGIRTTIFLKGCPLHCWWCHNPESQAVEPERVFRENRCIDCETCLAVCRVGAISKNGNDFVTNGELCTLCGDCVAACYAEAREIIGREVSVAKVIAEIEKDVAFYDESGGGVTFSGGEPLLQRDFLRELLRACREKEIHTTVDTSGFAPWATFETILPYTNLFLYDLKLMDDVAHQKFTGVSNRLILQNLQTLSRRGANIIVRLPVIPDITANEENFQQIGTFLAALPQPYPVELLPYHHIGADKYQRLYIPYQIPNIRPPSQESMTRLAEMLRSYNLLVKHE